MRSGPCCAIRPRSRTYSMSRAELTLSAPPLRRGSTTRLTRSSCSLSASWSRWVSRRTMSCSRASKMSSAVIARPRSRPASFQKQASEASAFTSHGWPRVCVRIASSASGVNTCPVAPVCCASSASTSSSERSPSRNDFALMSNALPPATTAFSGLPARGNLTRAALRAPLAGWKPAPRMTATLVSPPDRAEHCA